jgi:hypothetical protein
MQSSLIGKIEKAKRYAQETDRITFSEFKVSFRGEHDTHTTSLKDGKWNCTCSFFSTWKICSHTMAMERVLGNMLPQEALSGTFVQTTTP